jgi:GDPmannose 4,6-dehydratase
VCGVAGQDGALLAKLLLDKGYRVVGTSRDAAASPLRNHQRLGIHGHVEVVSMAVNDFRSVLTTLRACQPDEIYSLTGQSSVALSFEQPVETIESIALGTLNLLEAMRLEQSPARLYHAGSSECFGDTAEAAANEGTPFRPRSPYAVAKVTAHNLVANYREGYRLFASTGILFNHESPLRPQRFVTQKIVLGAARIAAGDARPLRLGSLDVQRDWGWAPDYVEAMWRMLQAPEADDYVIATGRTESLGYFVQRAFAYFGLDSERHVLIDDRLRRPTEVRISRADPSKAMARLGWAPTRDVDGVIDAMCASAAAELAARGDG